MNEDKPITAKQRQILKRVVENRKKVDSFATPENLRALLNFAGVTYKMTEIPQRLFKTAVLAIDPLYDFTKLRKKPCVKKTKTRLM